MKKVSYLIMATVMLISCNSSRKMSKTVQPKPLQETYWVLEEINGEKVDEKAPAVPFITFGAEGRCFGNLGCNSFFGTYIASKKRLSLEYAGSTKKLCFNMETEKRFNEALRKEITHYSIEGDTLILMGKDKKAVMRFVARVKPEEPKTAE